MGAGKRAGADAMDRETRDCASDSLSATVGDKRETQAPAHELAGQGLGRKDVSPGAAAGEHHQR